MLAGIGGISGKVLGIHPKNADTGAVDELRAILGTDGVVAVGECGFDAAGQSYAVQAMSFMSQCELAREFGLPLVIHIDGPGAFEQLASSSDAMCGLRVIRHYFTGAASEAEWHRERGHFLSFGNPLRRSVLLSQIAGSYPAGLLLIETDSYPVPGRTTEPKDVVPVAKAVAAIRGWTVDETRERLAQNTAHAFGHSVET